MMESCVNGTQRRRHSCGNGHLPIRVPRPDENKVRILTWILFWPWSLVWTVCLNPFRCIVRSLAHEIGATFDGISEHEFGAIEQDFDYSHFETEPAKPAKSETQPQTQVNQPRPMWSLPYPAPTVMTENESKVLHLPEAVRSAWRN